MDRNRQILNQPSRQMRVFVLHADVLPPVHSLSEEVEAFALRGESEQPGHRQRVGDTTPRGGEEGREGAAGGGT